MSETGQYRRLPDLPWWLPWAIIGLLVALGGLTSIVYGLPFARETDLIALTNVVAEQQARSQKNHDDIASLAQTQAVTADRLQNVASTVERIQTNQDKLTQTIMDLQTHIMGLEADEKARDSEEESRPHRR